MNTFQQDGRFKPRIYNTMDVKVSLQMAGRKETAEWRTDADNP
jgi:hypothetical protein